MTAGCKEFIWMAENLYRHYKNKRKGVPLYPPLCVIGQRWQCKAFHHDWGNKQTWWMCLVMTPYWFANTAFNTLWGNMGNKSSFHWNMQADLQHHLLMLEHFQFEGAYLAIWNLKTQLEWVQGEQIHSTSILPNPSPSLTLPPLFVSTLRLPLLNIETSKQRHLFQPLNEDKRGQASQLASLDDSRACSKRASPLMHLWRLLPTKVSTSCTLF